jgi:integrase
VREAELVKRIIIVSLKTGMRRGEILNLEWSQIDFSANRLIVTKNKSGEPREARAQGGRID